MGIGQVATREQESAILGPGNRNWPGNGIGQLGLGEQESVISFSGIRNWAASDHGTAPASLRPGTGISHLRVGDRGWQLATREQRQPARDHGLGLAIKSWELA